MNKNLTIIFLLFSLFFVLGKCPINVCATPVTNGLVAYYNYTNDHQNYIVDNSGNNNNTATNIHTLSQKWQNGTNVRVFNGSSNYITFPNTTAFNPTSGFTIGTLFYRNNSNWNGSIYRKYDTAGNQRQIELEFSNLQSNLRFIISSNGTSTGISDISTANITTGWHFIYAGLNTTTHKSFINIDGVEMANQTWNYTPFVGTAGPKMGDNLNGNFLNGYDAYYKMYNRGLSSSEIVQDVGAESWRTQSYPALSDIYFPPFTGYSYTKFSNYSQFVSNITNSNLTYYNLGASSNSSLNIYSVSVGDMNNTSKPVILFVGGQHGTEWMAPQFLLEYMKILNNPSNIPQATMINKLKSRFNFYAIICANPAGYQNDTYDNLNGVNINRNYPSGWAGTPDTGVWDFNYKGSSIASEPETKIIMNVINMTHPYMCLDLHILGGTTKSGTSEFFEVYPSGIQYYSLVNQIENNTKDLINRYELENNTVAFVNPLLGEYGGEQNSSVGSPTISFTVEIGYSEPTLEISRIGMNTLLISTYYANEKYNSSIPIANFTANKTVGNIPFKVNFTDNSSVASSCTYSWNFGDGSNISNEQNPSHIFKNSGNYITTLNVSNAYGYNISSTVIQCLPSNIVVHESPIKKYVTSKNLLLYYYPNNTAFAFNNTNKLVGTSASNIKGVTWYIPNGVQYYIFNKNVVNLTFTNNSNSVSRVVVNLQKGTIIYSGYISYSNKEVDLDENGIPDSVDRVLLIARRIGVTH